MYRSRDLHAVGLHVHELRVEILRHVHLCHKQRRIRNGRREAGSRSWLITIALLPGSVLSVVVPYAKQLTFSAPSSHTQHMAMWAAMVVACSTVRVVPRDKHADNRVQETAHSSVIVAERGPVQREHVRLVGCGALPFRAAPVLQ